MNVNVRTSLCLIVAFFATIAIQNGLNAQPYLSGVTATATSAQVFPASVLTNDNGLTETAPGSGVFALTTNVYAFGGSMWNSGYIALGGDENAIVDFDLGATRTVDSFHVWNYNDPGYSFRGFKDVTISYSNNRNTWKAVTQRFVFAKAPGLETYTGEEYTFDIPVTARYIRFQADSTHRGFAGRELAGLGKVRFHVGGVPTTPPPSEGVFPDDSGIIKVTDAPYNAQGDGVTDDTDALQQAINDWQGSRRTIYLPAGTYLVSRPLKLTPGTTFGFTNIRGESTGAVTIQLKDNTFTDPSKPQPVLSAAYNGTLPDANGNISLSADWFNNNFGHFTINTGTGNTGAIGLQFYSNNTGAVRNVSIVSGDGSGVIGLDLGYVDQNGPLLARDISVYGFNVGINCGWVVNSQVLENITIEAQNVVGIRNGGQCLSIHNLKATEAVTVFENTGVAVLVNASLETDIDTGINAPAIINNESLFARDITTSGFSAAIKNNYGGTSDAIGPEVREFDSHPILSLFGNRPRSLRLPILATPQAPKVNPNSWANVRNFRRITDPDDTASVQRAIDSGASTIYFPTQGTYFLSAPVLVRNRVQRIIGMHSAILKVTPDASLQVVAGIPATVFIEDTGSFLTAIDIVNASKRRLVCRNLSGPSIKPVGSGDIFLENVVTGPLRITGQKVWARQLNIEGRETKVTNMGGMLWTLGFKSEDGGTLVETRRSGKSELLGGLYYSQTGNLAPMFINNESSVSYTIGEVNFSNNPFLELVRETRGGITRTLLRGAAPFRRFVPGSMLPLYVGYDDATFLAPPSGVQAADGSDRITLSWDAMRRATSYTVRRATSANGTFTTIASNVTTTSYTDLAVTPGRRYYYQIRAVYPTGTSQPSATVNAAVGQSYRINAGGDAVGSFAADNYFDTGNTFYSGAGIDTSGVTDAAPQYVYQSERWNNQFTYTFPSLVVGTSYTVRLHFAEFVVNQPNQRVFNVTINGTQVLTNYDIVAKVGAFKAVVEEFTVPVDATGKITIQFSAVVANPKVSGFEVLIP